MRKLIYQIAEDKGFTVDEFETGTMDHVHLFVTAPPKLSPSLLVQYLKGITERKIMERYPDLKKQLWNHSYFVETVGDVSAETVRRYIENQSKHY